MDETNYSWVEQGLWIGGAYRDAEEVPEEVDVILNVASPIEIRTFPRPLHASLFMPCTEPIPSATWLHTVTGFISGCRAQGWRVLVHCDLGHGRAAFVVAAMLMRSYHWNRDTAIEYLKNRHPGISLHLGFYASLADWWTYLGSGRAG